MPFEVDENEIVQELEELGASASEDNIILKMKELCMLFQKNASDLVSSWVAFASTNGLDLDPTLDSLNQLEREDLTKKSVKVSRSNKTIVSLAPTVYNASTIDMVERTMNSYETPERKGGSRRITESQIASLEKSPGGIFSPSMYSPSSAKYSGRSCKGDILCSLGKTNEVEWKQSSSEVVQVSLFNQKHSLEKPYQYMFEKLRDRAEILNDIIEDMARILQEKHELEDYGHVRLPHLDEVNIIGRVCCDGNGKLNGTSVLIEGSLESSYGQVVQADPSKLPQYAFFPGQVIAAKATNVEGTKLVMKSLFESERPPFPMELPKIDQEPVDIVVAAGPFTTSDSLSFDPLADLLKCAKEHNPSVLILIGPFVDCKHELIQKGNFNETYEQLFLNQIAIVLQSLNGCSTTVILVPSIRDIHHHAVYPTPPFDIRTQSKKTPVFCAPDPCLLSINGLVIGITSVDILFHLGKEEISHPPGLSDRLGRLASHLLTQQSFYPLYPPSENVNIDYEHMDMYGRLTVCPHILITPSDLRCFVKDIHGCCCINPERLARGLGGGSYARIRVNPGINEQHKGSLIENIHVDVVRI